MGLDLDIYLLVGVDYCDVVQEEEKIVETITKYNPDTGEPYEYIKRKKVWRIADKVFDEEWEAYDYLNENGLSVYEEHGDPVFVGVTVSSHKGERVACGLGELVKLWHINDTVEDVTASLSKLGVTDVEVTVATFSSVSW